MEKPNSKPSILPAVDFTTGSVMALLGTPGWVLKSDRLNSGDAARPWSAFRRFGLDAGLHPIFLTPLGHRNRRQRGLAVVLLAERLSLRPVKLQIPKCYTQGSREWLGWL